MSQRGAALAAFMLLAGLSGPALAARALDEREAAAWLQKISDAARGSHYDGVFLMQHGAQTQSLRVSNRPIGDGSRSRLMTMDGEQREVRCSRDASYTLIQRGPELRIEKRINNRHFPDLLPEQAARLTQWYTVREAGGDRIAGRECSFIELIPKDAFRWGYILCVDDKTALPLRAVLVDGQRRALMQYRFAELRFDADDDTDLFGALTGERRLPPMPDAALPVQRERVSITGLPPGFTRIAALRRQLPNHAGEIDHWVFSDGLTHVSLFLEPASKRVEHVKGNSHFGMINLIKRPVGDLQAVVLGEAPQATVEAIAAGLALKP